MGSEDQLQILLKSIFICSGGSSGTRFYHGQFEIKHSLFTPRPTEDSIIRFDIECYLPKIPLLNLLLLSTEDSNIRFDKAIFSK